jgi:NIMA-interacting peptidyl-prolyl cis-trans isomerase 1
VTSRHAQAPLRCTCITCLAKETRVLCYLRDGTPPACAPILLPAAVISNITTTSLCAYSPLSSFAPFASSPSGPTALIAFQSHHTTHHGKHGNRLGRQPVFPIATYTTQSSEETGLPQGWEVRRSNTKNLPYYFHPETKDSRWEPPAGTNPDKLKEYMALHHSSKGVAPTSAAPEGNKIRAAHLLVKHRDSRRPASWREPKITRTKEEAQDLIRGYEAQIKKFEAESKDDDAKSLSELATTESDCSSARKGGDL